MPYSHKNEHSSAIEWLTHLTLPPAIPTVLHHHANNGHMMVIERMVGYTGFSGTSSKYSWPWSLVPRGRTIA